MVQTLVRPLVMLFPPVQAVAGSLYVPGYPPTESHILLSETHEFMKLLLASTRVFVIPSLDVFLNNKCFHVASSSGAVRVLLQSGPRVYRCLFRLRQL